MAKKDFVGWVNLLTIWLVSAGALNWGLETFFQFNIVTALSDTLTMPTLATYLFGAVAIAGLWMGIQLLRGKVKISK